MQGVENGGVVANGPYTYHIFVLLIFVKHSKDFMASVRIILRKKSKFNMKDIKIHIPENFMKKRLKNLY